MKKQVAIALGVLLTIGTAVSASLNESADTASWVASDSGITQLDSKQSAQIVALWNIHTNSAGSVPLARPL
jgi:hypothetical protein